MRIAIKLACLSLVTALAACGPDGYYDSRGHYHTGSATDSSQYDGVHMDRYGHSEENYYVDNSAVKGDSAGVIGYDRAKDPDVVTYKRSGYYDRNGYYIATDSGPNVPRAYFPPRGMCRVWFMDRMAVDQPPIESCRGIQSRVPDNAYVVYGG